jgi:hypothetical protein
MDRAPTIAQSSLMEFASTIAQSLSVDHAPMIAQPSLMNPTHSIAQPSSIDLALTIDRSDH